MDESPVCLETFRRAKSARLRAMPATPKPDTFKIVVAPKDATPTMAASLRQFFENIRLSRQFHSDDFTTDSIIFLTDEKTDEDSK